MRPFASRRSVHRFALAAAVLLSGAVSVQAQGIDAAECGRFRAEMRQARDLITRHRAPEARPILARALAAEPNNITANFLVGLIKLDDRSPKVQLDGLRAMEQAAAMIPTRPARCAVARNWYSMHVTIGAEYYNRGERNLAKKHYAAAYAQRSKMEPISKQILLENLGRAALSEGDTNAALAYYQEGAREGLNGAPAMVARIKQLQTAAR